MEGPFHRRAGTKLATATAALVFLAGCASDTVVSSGPPPPDGGGGGSVSSLPDMTGESGELVPVSAAMDPTLTGYVSAADLSVHTDEHRLVPVVDESGEQVAWWASGAGWLTFEQVESGPDLKALVDSRTGEGVERPAA